LIHQNNYVTALQSDISLEHLLSSERHNILSYLPLGLKTGKIFNDQIIDDITAVNYQEEIAPCISSS
jgi:hypothetical protein